MPIKKRITSEAARADIKRKSKGRHPLLQRLDSPHLAVWQTIVQDGNPEGGITARELRQLVPQFHPQVLKDLQDSFLVVKRDKNAHQEFRYVGDTAGRGAFVQTVTIDIALYEDESGKFFTQTTLTGSDNVAGRIVRKVGDRRIHMRVPMLEEGKHEDVSDFDQPVLGDTKRAVATTIVVPSDLAGAGTCIIEG